ncbi:MAG: DUF58 domain-containing protein [Pirellulaceae bacterium]
MTRTADKSKPSTSSRTPSSKSSAQVAELRDATGSNELKSLQLLAKSTVDGLTGGRHRSKHRGSSVEFKEHRAYVRGDAIQSIDWKLFGKSDRFFIRQYEDETSLRGLVLLDQSGSMGYSGTQSSGLTKHDFAVRLAACLATLLVRQQDAAGLVTCDTEMRQLLLPRSTPAHLNAILAELAASRPNGETSLGKALKTTAGRLKKRGLGRSLIFLISDCFDDVLQIASAVKLFRHHGHDVTLFQVWDHDELHFPFRNRTEFKSLESTSQRLVDPNSLRLAYLEKVERFRQDLSSAMRKQRVDVISCLSNQSCTEVLREWLHTRSRAS